jgi:hypothetical protein
MKTATIIIASIAATLLVSCEPTPVYVPVYVPTEKKVERKVYVPVKPAPQKPVESAEGFRAVEKPTTYSN